MKLPHDLFLKLVSVLPFHKNLFSSAKVEQLVYVIDIKKIYYSNS